MFKGLPQILERDGNGSCEHCRYRRSYGADIKHKFGGVQLCASCSDEWRDWFWTLPVRAARVFPSLSATLDKERDRIHKPRSVAEKADTSKPLINGHENAANRTWHPDV